MEFAQASLPGISAVRETGDWAGYFRGDNSESLTLRADVIIGSAAVDAGNTGLTTTLRAGIMLAKKTSDGKYYPFVATATDGTQNPEYILPLQLSMLGPNGVVEDKQVAAYARTNVVVSQVPNQTEQAIRILATRGFNFDAPVGAYAYPAPRGVEVVSGATLLTAADSGKRYICITNAVAFTLPTIAAGLKFEFINTVDANMSVTAPVADTMVADGDAAATTITFSTASHKIGSRCIVEAIQYGASLMWFVENLGGTVATPT